MRTARKIYDVSKDALSLLDSEFHNRGPGMTVNKFFVMLANASIQYKKRFSKEPPSYLPPVWGMGIPDNRAACPGGL
jgi:hypothetical protein